MYSEHWKENSKMKDRLENALDDMTRLLCQVNPADQLRMRSAIVALLRAWQHEIILSPEQLEPPWSSLWDWNSKTGWTVHK